MIQTIIQNKFKILGIISLVSGVAGYWAYHKSHPQKKVKFIPWHPPSRDFVSQLLNNSKTPQQTSRYQIQKSVSLYSQYYFDKNLQSRKVLDHLDNEGITVESIYKYSPIIAVDQYNKFTKEIRKRRRLIRGINQDQYIKLVLEYEKEIDQLLERSRYEVVEDCEVDPDQYEKMKDTFQITEDLAILGINAKKYLKELGYNRKRPIPKPVLLKIINEQVSFIRSKLYDRLKVKLQNDYSLDQDQILRIIQTLIEDIVYEKYGYEKQQISYAITQQWSIQLIKQIKQLKRARSQLKSDIGNFDLVSQESGSQLSEEQKRPSSQAKTRSNVNSSIYSIDSQQQQNIKIGDNKK